MKKLLLFGVMAALLAGTSACSKPPQKAAPANTPKAEAKQTVDAFGVVKAREIKNINLDFVAAIDKVNVKEGEKVKSGDVLFLLNISEYQTQIRNKERDLQTTQGELRRLKQELATKQEYLNEESDPDLKKLYNEKRNAEELYNKMLQELANKEALRETGGVSQYDLEEFKKTVDAKRKAVDDANYSIDSLKYKAQKEIDQLKTTIEQKISQAAGLEEDISTMKDRLDKNYLKQNEIICEVQNGVAYDISYQAGDIINPGQQSTKKLLSILNSDTLFVEANVPEEFIRDVKIGAEVTVIPLADQTKKYSGKVTKMADKAALKNNETTVAVEISIEGRDEFLRSDFNVNVKISIEPKQ